MAYKCCYWLKKIESSPVYKQRKLHGGWLYDDLKILRIEGARKVESIPTYQKRDTVYLFVIVNRFCDWISKNLLFARLNNQAFTMTNVFLTPLKMRLLATYDLFELFNTKIVRWNISKQSKSLHSRTRWVTKIWGTFIWLSRLEVIPEKIL